MPVPSPSTHDMADGEHEVLGWDRFFAELRSLLVFCYRGRERADRQFAAHAVERLRIAVQNVSAISDVLRTAQEDLVRGYAERMDDVVLAIHLVIGYWESYMENLDNQLERLAYHAPLLYTGRRGRPAFHVPSDQLVYLRNLSFSWTNIASILGVSRMTIYRCRRAYGLLEEPNAVPNDAELERIIRRIRLDAPDFGQVLVHGRVRAMGYHVTRERVRREMRKQDPLNTALRMPGGLTSRRKYSVPGPNSLWHVGKYAQQLVLGKGHPNQKLPHPVLW